MKDDKTKQQLLKELCLKGDLAKVEEFFVQLNMEEGSITRDIIVNMKDDKGWSALHWVIDSSLELDKKLAIVNSLIMYGIKVNMKDNKGNTALHIAVSRDKLEPEVIELLIINRRNKADLHLENNEKKSPLQMLEEQKKKIISEQLDQLILLIPGDPQIKNLCSKIERMEDYGNSLQSHAQKPFFKRDYDKGDASTKLAKELKSELGKFVIKLEEKKPDGKMNDDEIKQFTKRFIKLLHSKDEEMKKHRKAWKPIVANIFLAFTGIGLIAIALKAISARIKKDNSLNGSLFFTQTKSLQNTQAVEQAFKSFNPQKK